MRVGAATGDQHRALDGGGWHHAVGHRLGDPGAEHHNRKPGVDRFHARRDCTGGTLALLEGRSFSVVANGGSFTDSGLLNVEGGSFSATTLTITATGTFLDAGSFSGAIANAGEVNIADGTVLTLTGGGSLGGAFDGAGTLKLSGTTAFTLTRPPRFRMAHCRLRAAARSLARAASTVRSMIWAR